MLQAKILPDQSFDAVANNCFFTDFLGDHQAQSCMAQLVLGSIDTEVGIVRALSLLKHMLELSRFQQSLRFFKCSRASRHAENARGGESGAQARATLRATGANNCSTTAGFHACTKTVSALAFQYAGLKCTFHDRESA